MARVREKNLDDTVVGNVVEVLDGWSGRLTWDALIEELAKREGLRYTRQALHRHESIRLAFTVRKKVLSGQPSELRVSVDPDLQVALERIDRLEAEVQRLKAEKNNLREQFARWAYNAHTRNLTEEFLNTPLPGVDREQSRSQAPTRKLKPAAKGSN
ncbi:hypothetical protein PQR46_43975 [Paraburkholderia sediminicola]|jgi:hypothetical protein|uniref:hypothetical protein n=1 Tax=Paraburkholderia TaxID=1822464 RepID=UPI0038B85369